MIVKKDYLGSKIICEYNSSNLKKGEYDINTKKLDITFNNGMVYEYDDVPHEVFSEMNIAESQGKYFNQKIAKNYTYRKK
jgi:hypothetical protein